jgi:hypothetical protein
VSLKSAPAPRDMARHRGHHLAIRTCRCRRQLRRYQPARPGSVSTVPRAARSKSAPPTARTTARAGIGTQRRPGRAIPAGPLRRRTGTAAAQVGKRCQLSNRTRHDYIIAHTYDNVRALPGLPFPRVFAPCRGPQASISGHCGQGRDRTADLPLFRRSLIPTELPGQPSTPGGCGDAVTSDSAAYPERQNRFASS